MRRLIFATQKLDPGDPVLAATVPMVWALAARVDELVVLCDTAVSGVVPGNVRVREFGAPTQAQRGARFVAALARELRPRPLGVVAHMVPLYAVLAAPLVRPLRVPLLLWYTHWKGHAVVRAAEKLSTAVISVDRRSFPLRSGKVHAIGHGIDLSEFPCVEPTDPAGELRALVLGRYSPAKGLETIVRAAAIAGVHVELHGSDAEFEEYKRRARAARARRRRKRRAGRSGRPRRYSGAVRAQRRADQQHARRGARQGRVRSGGLLPYRCSRRTRSSTICCPRSSASTATTPRCSPSGCARSTADAVPSCATSSLRGIPSTTGPTACWLPWSRDDPRPRPPSRRRSPASPGPRRTCCRCCRGCASAAGTCVS